MSSSSSSHYNLFTLPPDTLNHICSFLSLRDFAASRSTSLMMKRVAENDAIPRATFVDANYNELNLLKMFGGGEYITDLLYSDDVCV